MESPVAFIDPELIDGKRVVVVGAAELGIPLLIDALFTPESIDAVDTELWRYILPQIRELTETTKCPVNLHPLAHLDLEDLRATGASPWDVGVCCVQLEMLEHPLSLLDDLSCVTANALVVATHAGVDSDLPVMLSAVQGSRMDHTGAYWQISSALIDSYMGYLGYHTALDLTAIRDEQTSRQEAVGAGDATAPAVQFATGEYCKVWLKI